MDGTGKAHARTRSFWDGVDSIDPEPVASLKQLRNAIAHNQPIVDYGDVEDKLGLIHNRYNSAVREARDNAETSERHWYNDLVQPCGVVQAEIETNRPTSGGGTSPGFGWPQWDCGHAHVAHADSDTSVVDEADQYASFYGHLASYITDQAKNSPNSRRLRPIYDEHASAQLPLWSGVTEPSTPSASTPEGADSWLLIKIDDPVKPSDLGTRDKTPKNLVIIMSPQARAARESANETPPTALKLDLEGSTVVFALTGTEDSRELVEQLEKVWKTAAKKTTDRTPARKS